MSPKTLSRPSSEPISRYVNDSSNPLLRLFPHRQDYIWAELPVPGDPVAWQTERRHPLSDRLILQGGHLYGVRFGKRTAYAMLDIDAGSPYHPTRDPFAVRAIVAALEPLGITHSLIISSSHSGGLHVYLPISEAQQSRTLALAIKALVEHQGFKVAAGVLELFPDAKPYVSKGKPSMFAAHRLPLQAGSYILNDGWEPVYSLPEEFVRRWEFCAAQNQVSGEGIRQVLRIYQRQDYRLSGKAAHFLKDLDAEIEMGWTGPRQTNKLLGRIAIREYIFGHVLHGTRPLEGDALVEQIVKVAIALPGYHDWCRHQHEIYQRAKDWARCVERSERYYHYGSRHLKRLLETPEGPPEETPSWNQQQSLGARERIQRAVAELTQAGTLPSQTTRRFKALMAYHIGSKTLYRYPELWHPKHYPQADSSPVENPPAPPVLKGVGAQYEEECAPPAPSLLPIEGCNPSWEERLSDRPTPTLPPGCNVHDEQNWMAAAQAVATARETIAYQQQRRLEEQQKRHQERMQSYLDSGDPILVAEARLWAQGNPGILRDPPAAP